MEAKLVKKLVGPCERARLREQFSMASGVGIASYPAYPMAYSRQSLNRHEIVEKLMDLICYGIAFSTMAGMYGLLG
jgi:hypothetical protein